MEPTQSAGAAAPNQDQNPNNQPTASADTSGAATSDTSNGTGQQSADGKTWLEFANLQKVVDQLPQGVKDFCTNSWNQVGKTWGQVGGQVGKMSTTQKVAGAAALAGIGYLAMRSGKKSSSGKGAGAYKAYRGGSSHTRSEQNPYSGSGYASGTGSGQSYAAGSQADDSRRLDRGPGHWNGSNNSSSFDRENVSRSGGSYSTGSGSASPDYGFGSTSPSSSTYRSAGSSSGASASDDFSSGI